MTTLPLKRFLKLLIPLLLTLTLLEGGARLYFILKGQPRMGVMRISPPNAKGSWKNLPYEVPLRSGRITRELANGEIVMDVPFSIDSGSRRNSLKPAGTPKNYLIFVGCSFTFGSGVLDHETLPSHIQALTNKYRVYNYGYSGSSPEEALYRLQNIEANELKELNGRVVYTFFYGHLQRHFWQPDFIAWWGHRKSIYEKKNGKVTNIGSYAQVHPLKTFFYQLRVKSDFYRLLKHSFPDESGDEELNSFAKYVGKMSVEAQRLTGKNLLMIIWPSEFQSPKLLNYLQENNIDVINLSNLNLAELTNNKHLIPHDRHPTSLAYEVIAKNLIDQLNGLKE